MSEKKNEVIETLITREDQMILEAIQAMIKHGIGAVHVGGLVIMREEDYTKLTEED